jgi:hypothetical protein
MVRVPFLFFVDAVEHYDPASDTWYTTPTLPAGRREGRYSGYVTAPVLD